MLFIVFTILATSVANALLVQPAANVTTGKAAINVPHAALAVAVHHKLEKKDEAVPTVHDHAVAAQKDADEAAMHLAKAKAAFQKTKKNVKDILKTGKKIESTAGNIKTLYTAPKQKPKPKATPAPPEETEIEFPSLETRIEKEQQQSYAARVIGQIIFGVLYYLLIVKHYPSFRDLPPPNEGAKALQQVNEVTATTHASLSNCILSWCCSGPRAAHTFYSTIGFNYWAGCILMSCFPCCTLWYMNSFRVNGMYLNEKLGGQRRSAMMGLICACFCSCCVIAQDAESLDRITGYETRLCSVRPMK
jgi:hypothetical protein